MRVRIKIDSATPEEVYNFTLAFQRSSRNHEIPSQIADQPTVTVCGVAMGWETPALRREHVEDLLKEYRDLQPQPLAEWEKDLLYQSVDKPITHTVEERLLVRGGVTYAWACYSWTEAKATFEKVRFAHPERLYEIVPHQE